MGQFNLIFSPFYWRSPVLETSDILNKCMGKIEENIKESPVNIPPKWECIVHSSYQSSSSNMKLDASFLNPIYSKYVATFLSEYGFKQGQFNIHNPWYNVFLKTHFQEPHTHLPCDFSAVHYAVFDKAEHLPTTFVHPNIMIPQYTKASRPNLMSKVNYNLPEHSCFSEHYTPQNIEPGDLIIFPAFLNHYVKPNTSEKRRITITFNIEMM